ncbi:MAG: nucleotidyltransferase substrate binding protein [Candidatus Omnitrophica bacterium]|nr:nucleotidyltransferase substrate binding protein [Candidatus Omnitrophota bacterium]
MTQERIHELTADYQNALRRLREAAHEDASKGSIVIDGTIQRFEFTFELAWKLLKNILAFQGVEAATPRTAVKEAFRAGLIQDGQGWIDMLEDRNQTSHLYDEDKARTIFQKIITGHLNLLETLSIHLNTL